MAGGVDQVDQVSIDGGGYGHCGDFAASRENHLLSQGKRRRCVGRGVLCIFLGAQHAQHLGFVCRLGVVEQYLHHKAVHLRLGQRVGAFLLDGVLRGQHHKQWGQRVAVAGDGDLPLFHGFKQGCLHLGRGAVDFVGQDQIAEQWPGLKTDQVLAVNLVQHLRAGDVRWQQVGRELDTAHLRIQVSGQRLDGAGLGQSRQAFEEQMTVGQQADDDLANNLVLAQHRFGDAGLQGIQIVERCHLAFLA